MQKSSETLKKHGFRIARGGVLSCALAAVMTMYLPAMALAEPYDLNTGSITVNSDGSGNRTVSQDNGVQNHQETSETVITSNNTETTNTVTINSSGTGDNAAEVTLQNVNIYTPGVAVSTSGTGDVSIELNGINTLHSDGTDHAGLEKGNTGNLTIRDDDNAGTAAGGLIAIGAFHAAGIGGTMVVPNGGGNNGVGSNITITGGTVTAIGGNGGAGIGGGNIGAGSNITIKGGTVIATGGQAGAGIGGGLLGAGSNITIEAGTVMAKGGIGGAGIGGGDGGGAGSNITISGGEVTAIGGIGGAGIGGGFNGIGSGTTISGPADVSVAGGAGNRAGGSGAAIGNGGSSNNDSPVQGDPVDPDTNRLYNTGTIKIYGPGTTADQMNNPANLTTDPIIGTVEPPAESEPEDEPEQPQPGPSVAAIVTANDSYAPATTTTAEDVDAAFYAAVDMQVEDLLKEINALIAEGKLNEVNALIAKGLKINAGTHKGFNASTLAKLGEASRMGIAVTVNFVYAGTSYSVTIPGHSVIDPVSLVDQNGYCGFLNLVKYFG